MNGQCYGISCYLLDRKRECVSKMIKNSQVIASKLRHGPVVVHCKSPIETIGDEEEQEWGQILFPDWKYRDQQSQNQRLRERWMVI